MISTTDDAHWKKQRAHLVEAFLPQSSLKEIFLISLSRAEACAARLGGIAADAEGGRVQMHEFFLHEAQAQLQLGLFGVTEDYMESTNQSIRDSFAGINPDPEYLQTVALDMMEKVESDPEFALPTAVKVGFSLFFSDFQ